MDRNTKIDRNCFSHCHRKIALWAERRPGFVGSSTNGTVVCAAERAVRSASPCVRAYSTRLAWCVRRSCCMSRVVSTARRSASAAERSRSAHTHRRDGCTMYRHELSLHNSQPSPCVNEGRTDNNSRTRAAQLLHRERGAGPGRVPMEFDRKRWGAIVRSGIGDCDRLIANDVHYLFLGTDTKPIAVKDAENEAVAWSAANPKLIGHTSLHTHQKYQPSGL